MLRKLRHFFQPIHAPTVQKPTAETLFNACFSILHGERRDFDIAVDKSLMKGAGLGLIIKSGRIRSGDIVALYSGKEMV